MKNIITLIILFSNFSYAESTCEDISILAQGADFTNIQCHLESKLRKPNPSFCKNCNISEDILNKTYMKEVSQKEISLMLHKTVAQPLLDTFKIGNEKNFNIDACSFKSLNENLNKFQGCAEENKHLIDSYKQTIAVEMAKFSSKSYLETKISSIFNRSQSTNSCNISEAEVLSIEIKNLERDISKDSLEKMAQTAMQVSGDIEEAIQGNTNLSQETRNIYRHPIIRNLLINDPKKILNYVQSQKSLKSKDIVSWLYSKDNISALSNQANAHCKKSFETIAKTICSDDFKLGNVSINNYAAFSKNVDDKFKNHTTALYCSQFKSSPLSIEDIVKKGLENDQLALQGQSKESFRDKFFASQVNEKREQMCLSLTSPCTDKKSPKCLLAEDVKEATQKNVSSFDKETIKKLRNILGSDVQADDATKKTLIASGLMIEKDFSQTPPTPKVSSTPSPMAPEKERELFGKIIKPVTQPIAQNFSGANFNTVPSYNTNSSYNESVQEEVREKYREKSPVLPPSTAAYLKEMSSMNRDLLDRLVKERGAKDKYSMDEIKDQLAKLSKERELPLPLDQQAQFFDHEWSENAPKVMPYIPEDLKKDKSGRTIASIDTPVTGKALQDKKYQDQRNRALEQFGKGEVSNNNSTSDGTTIVMSVNNEAALKKVRLDVPTDKIEKLNLSSILGQKLVSDKEGEKLQQLIQNKQSFLLDIEGKVAFMVEYSDSKKGFDLKTLKNSLPVEVFEKIKTQISQFLISNERKHEYQALKQELKVQ